MSKNLSGDLTEEEVSYLTKVYTNPAGSGALGGVGPLYRVVKEEGIHNISRKDVADFLSGRDEYTLHRPISRKFPTQHIIIGGPNDTVQMDLIDMGRGSARVNDGVMFILTVIDCFSKMAYAEPLVNKSAISIITALDKIYKNKDTPTTIVSDAGTEFTNTRTQKWMKGHNIQHHTAYGIHKAQFVERFNRSLKSLLSRYMTLHNTLRYLDVLQNIMRGYNSRYHSATGYKPIDVNETNAKAIFLKMYGSPGEWFKKLKKKRNSKLVIM